MRFLILLLAIPIAVSLQAFDHSAYDGLLKRHVNQEGMVDYAALKTNRESLDAYLQQTAAVTRTTFDRWSEAEQLAFLINVYNAETLQYIIDNYPVESIKKLGSLLSSAWARKNVGLFGKQQSLDYLEHELIRVEYADEPRIHFALVCAAVSCPRLRTEAFTGSRLEAQLESQTRVFLNTPEKNRLEGNTLYLSPLFDWYEKDFTKGGKSVQEYVAPYMKGEVEGKKIRYTDYDWGLNKQ